MLGQANHFVAKTNHQAIVGSFSASIVFEPRAVCGRPGAIKHFTTELLQICTCMKFVVAIIFANTVGAVGWFPYGTWSNEDWTCLR